MSASYKAVGWNAFKKRYDVVLGIAIVLFLAVFIGVGLVRSPGWSIEILLMRATATASLVLLHVILAIGPMARICLLYTSPSPRDLSTSRMPSSA